jgi:hypothetical protein
MNYDEIKTKLDKFETEYNNMIASIPYDTYVDIGTKALYTNFKYQLACPTD